MEHIRELLGFFPPQQCHTESLFRSANTEPLSVTHPLGALGALGAGPTSRHLAANARISSENVEIISWLQEFGWAPAWPQPSRNDHSTVFRHEGKYEFIQSSNSTQKKLVNWSPIIAFVKDWKETNRSFAAQTSQCVAYYPSFIMSGDQWATKHQTSKPHMCPWHPHQAMIQAIWSPRPSPGEDCNPDRLNVAKPKHMFSAFKYGLSFCPRKIWGTHLWFPIRFNLLHLLNEGNMQPQSR